MTYEVRIATQADRAMAGFPAKDLARLVTKMRLLREDPMKPRSGLDIRRLQASGGAFRLRVGVYRVFYVVFPADGVVVVTDVRHRSHAYD